jgi:hypothetical protein
MEHLISGQDSSLQFPLNEKIECQQCSPQMNTSKQEGKIFCTQNKNLKRKYIYTSVDGAPRNVD